MNTFQKLKFILIILIVFKTINLSGQRILPENPGESVSYITDRNLYITGENIKFSAFIRDFENTDDQNSSKVLYCEVINSEGVKICGNKNLISGNFSKGELLIPEDISTGVYFFRAYTRYMRNWGPSLYYYTLIKVVNAKRGEIQQKENLDELTDFDYGKSNPTGSSDPFEISLDKLKYKPGDHVNLVVRETKAGTDPFMGISISVVPEYTVNYTKIEYPANGHYSSGLFYSREIQGPVISGKLVDNSTGKPVADSRVNLSVIGNHKDFIAQNTDPSGRFMFSMADYYGCHDLFLCTEDTVHSKLNLLVDNDFCSAPVRLPSYRFILSPEERNTALKMAVNLQVESYFESDAKTGISARSEEISFYGKPSDIIYIDDYVHLPTLEEYFNSLPSLVRVRKHSGKKYFKIISTQSGVDDYDPLVLVDMVAIGNPVKVLAIQPASILRIEVVNSLYVKGDQKYGGIINIITKKGDFGGIDLPSSGMFINYCFLSENITEITSQGKPNLPDTRNTLFWDPQLKLGQDKSSRLSFSTSDTPGNYLIVLSWINSKGETKRQISEFEVKK
jgi:hypothetical protein